jgi:hypothetical protein
MCSTGLAGAVARSSPHVRHLGPPATTALLSHGSVFASSVQRSPGGLRADLRAHTNPQLVTTQKSELWAGYEEVGSLFTEVGAQWVVPAIQPSAGNSISSEWIGIGGSGAIPTLIQCGTLAGQTGGTAQYVDFYELYPAPNVLLPTPVSPGDLMVAVITETSPGMWQIKIDDQTKGWNFQKSFAWSSADITSAEWIMEYPTNGNFGLADFGTLTFTHLAAHPLEPTFVYLVEETLVSRGGTGDILAVPGPLRTSPTTHVSFTIKYTGPTPTPPSKQGSGYDLVGSDGGVFVFPTGQSGGFYGSLPGLGVKPAAPVVGMVPTSSDQGYFLVGSDGGVFAFGTAPFLGSLPGLRVTPTQPITGIVAANTDKGYFLVGKDGGVFAFGTVPFLGSLPGKGISVKNIIGIASTPSGNGYWLVSATGTVYGFGAAQALGTAKGTSSPVSAIAGTPTGGGYWITTQNGAVHAFGNAKSFGTLPGLHVTPALPVIGIVHTAGTAGYWLIGADGGIFAFGDAGFVGSLPGVNVHVTDVVGAVPTTG